MATVFITIGFFGLCMTGMALGLLVRQRELSGSCGGAGVRDADGELLSCGTCARKDADVCPTDNDLAELAQIAYPGPRHHH